MVRRVAGALTCAAVLGGCSGLLMQRPHRSEDASVPPRCTTSKVWPIVDFALAAADVAAIALGTREQESNALTAVWAVEGVAHLVSGGFGVSWARECRRMRRDYADVQRNQAAFDRASVEEIGHHDAPFYCSRDACWRAEEQCTDDCAASNVAVCFEAGGSEHCFPTPRACDAARDADPSAGACETVTP
jgi:hypothetical protein